MVGRRTPKDALRDAIARTVLSSSLRSQADVPGAVIESMSPEDRELLRQLTSEDAADVRVECCLGDPPWGSPVWQQKAWQYTLLAILEGRYR
jgi:hypothetical protein